MNSHRFDINNYADQGYATKVALHFNSYSLSLHYFSFLNLLILSIMDGLYLRTYWIHKLDLLQPKGITVKPVLSGHLKEHQKQVFKTNYCLMQVKSIWRAM